MIERLKPIHPETKRVILRVHPTTYCLQCVDAEAKDVQYKQIEKSIFRKDEKDMSLELYKAYQEYEFYTRVYSKTHKDKKFELIVRVNMKDGTSFNLTLVDIRGTRSILNYVYSEVEEQDIKNVAVMSINDITDKYTFSTIKNMFNLYHTYLIKERNRIKAEKYRSSLSPSGRQILDYLCELNKSSIINDTPDEDEKIEDYGEY